MKNSSFIYSLSLCIAFPCFSAVVFEDGKVKAEVYGRAEFNVVGDNDVVRGIGTSRFGFKAHSHVGEGLNAVVRGEWDIIAENSDHSQSFSLQNGQSDPATGTVTGFVDVDSSKSLSPRHVYAGFEVGEYGRLLFGQTETAFYDALASTDIFNSYGFAGSDIIYIGRQEGQIIYTADLNDVHLSASYQLHDDDAILQLGGSNGDDVVSGSQDSPVVLDSAFATTLGYTFSFGLSAFAAYSQEVYEAGTKQNWAASTSYIKNALYLAAVYAQGDMGDASLKGYEAVVGYDFSPILIYGGYNKQKASDIVSANNGTTTSSFAINSDSADNWIIGSQFDFNSYLIAWFEYKLDNATNITSGEKNNDNWTVALQYDF